MSIKLYHGYALPRITSLQQAITWRKKLFSRFEKEVPTILATEIVKKATHLIDHAQTRILFGRRPITIEREMGTDTNALSLAWSLIRKDLKEDTNPLRRRTQLQITLLAAKGKTLCLLHNHDEETENFFRKHSGAQPFPYGTSTDPDPKVSPQKWKERGQLWNEALLKESGFPYREGLVAQSQDPNYYLWDVKSLPAPLLNIKARARKQAIELLLELALEEETNRLSRFMEVYEKILTSSRTKALAHYLEDKLPPLYNWKSLQTAQIKTKIKTP